MLNAMGLSMVVASYLWEVSDQRSTRSGVRGGATALTIAGDAAGARRRPGWRRCRIRSRPTCDRPATTPAFPLFPWAGFLFAGVLVGDLVDARPRGDPAGVDGQACKPASARHARWS